MKKTPALSLTMVLLPLGLFAQGATRLRLEAPSSATSGTLVETAAWLDLERQDVLSWSISVFLEGVGTEDLTTVGTDFERLSQGGFAENRISEDGLSYSSVGVLSFTEPVALPKGSSEVLRAVCRVLRKEPGEAKIVPRDGFESPDLPSPVKNEVLVQGGKLLALIAEERAIAVRGCAEFVLAPEGREPGDEPVLLEVEKGDEVRVDILVKVRSAAHLQPAGFSLGVAHDPEVLSLESASYVPEFLDTFVKKDGYAQVQVSERGFAASLMCSVSVPATIPTGTHTALRAVYRFHAPGEPGDVVATRLRLADGLPLADKTVPTVFQPNDALPCSLQGQEVELKILAEPWIRGDGNADGVVDISDAVYILRHLFLGGSASCKRAMEVNLDAKVDLSDGVALLSHLFLGAPAPQQPFPACGRAEDDLPCEITSCR